MQTKMKSETVLKILCEDKIIEFCNGNQAGDVGCSSITGAMRQAKINNSFGGNRTGINLLENYEFVKLPRVNAGYSYLITVPDMDITNAEVGGQLVRFGNIILNFWDLLKQVVSKNTITILSLANSIYKDNVSIYDCVIFMLSICKNLRRAMSVDLTPAHVYTMLALWRKCDKKRFIEYEAGYDAVSAFYNDSKKSEIDKTEYEKIIKSLNELKCITIEGNMIKLREKVKFYPVRRRNIRRA